MRLWAGIVAAYVLTLAGGAALGRAVVLHARSRRGTSAPDPALPAGWLPLGSAFDRALLPGVFDADRVGDAT